MQLTYAESNRLGDLVNDDENGADDGHQNGRDGPKPRLDTKHSSEPWAGLVSGGQGFSEGPARPRIDCNHVFHEIIDPWIDLGAFEGGADAKWRRSLQLAVGSDDEDAASNTVQNRRAGHRKDAEPDNVGGTAYDQEGRNGSNGEGEYPMGDVKGPATVGAQGPEEVFFFDQSKGSHGELDISWTTPDGSDNGEHWTDLADREEGGLGRQMHTYESLDVSRKCHGVVQDNGNHTSIDHHQKDCKEQLPTLPSSAPGKGKLWE